MKNNDVGQSAPEILVVDDMPANVQIISLMLKTKGYKVRVALGGKLALQAVRDNPPDLILLDINMPEMDGYEVCERLKHNDKSYLLETAVKFSSGKPVTVACNTTPLSVEVAICAKGRIMPDDMLAEFFDVFTASRPIKDVGDLGLGPPVAKRIFSLFGGSVFVRNENPAGVSFIVTCRTCDQ